jgi:hypothetical protein
MSPPTRESRPGGYSETASKSTARTDHDLTRRRRYRRESTGLRASGFREGYAAALRWSQREFDEHLDEIGRARLGAVVARSEAS